MAVRMLMLVAVLLGDSPSPVSYELGLDTFLKLTVVAVSCLLVGAAVLLTVLYLIRRLLTENRLNTLRTVLTGLRTVLTANWLRTAWIGVGELFFVMVVVPDALLIYQYSGIGD